MIDQDFLVALGLDPDTAGALCELIAEQTAAEAHRLAGELFEKRASKLPRVLAATPGGGSTISPEQLKRMSYAERSALFERDKQRYRELSAGR